MPDTCPCRQRWREMGEAAAAKCEDEAYRVCDNDREEGFSEGCAAMAEAIRALLATPPDCICSPGVVAAARKWAEGREPNPHYRRCGCSSCSLFRAVKESTDAD